MPKLSEIKDIGRNIDFDLTKTDGPKNPCWEGYEMVGTKMLNGKRVPNCVKKTRKLADIIKTEHDPATGQFTSSSGKSYSMKEAKGTGGALHDVHDDAGKKVGSVSSGVKAGKTSSQTHHGKLEGKGFMDPYDTPTIVSTTRKPANGGGSTYDPDAHNRGRMKAAKILADAHEAQTKKSVKGETTHDEAREAKRGIAKVKDDSGHEHGKDGRFASVGEAHGAAASALASHYGKDNPQSGAHDASDPMAHLDSGEKRHVHGLLSQVGGFFGGKKTAKQRIEDKHTNPKTGAVDYDKATAERREGGHFKPAVTNHSRGVFMIGGGGVGKGGIVQDYVGTGGQKRKDGSIIKPGEDGFRAPLPGFHPDRVFDSDAEKKKNPLYSDKSGERRDHSPAADPTMYGPSGPKTGADLKRYSPEEQEALHAHVRAQTSGLYKDAHEFARATLTGPRNPKAHKAGDTSSGHFNDGTNADTEFDGGLTHELSSHVVKEKLRRAIAHPEEGSFVYDSTGSDKYIPWATQAMDNGYQATFHHAVASPEVAQYRNQGRERTVDPELLAETHRKVAEVTPALKAFADTQAAAGRPMEYIPQDTMTDEDHAEALNAGMTANGPPAGFVHPKKAAKADEARKESLRRAEAEYRKPSATRDLQRQSNQNDAASARFQAREAAYRKTD